MKTEKRDKRMEEIRILDKGKNFDGRIVAWWCCPSPSVPYRS